MGQPTPPPAWYADPAGSGQLRWWDGQQWTQHLQPQGQPQQPQGSQQQQYPQGYQQQQPYQQQTYQQQGYQQAPPRERSAFSDFEGGVDGRSMDAHRVRQQVQTGRGGSGAGAPPIAGGGGTLFTEPVLVVNQRAKMFEAVTEYSVFDQNGTQIGAVAQVGQSGFGKAMKMFTKYDALMPVRLEVRDANEVPQILVHKPVSLWKARINVTTPDGAPIGEIGQDNVFGKIRFNYLVNGQRIGGMRAENFRAWDFQITDANDQEIARITKTFEGIAKAMFTTADNYVLRIHAPLQGPLAPLVIGSALTVDTVLKQDKG